VPSTMRYEKDTLVFNIGWKDRVVAVKIYKVPKGEWGVATLLHSGSPKFVRQFIEYAKSKGYRIEPYKVTDLSNNKVLDSLTEVAIWDLVHLKFLPYNQRDDLNSKLKNIEITWDQMTRTEKGELFDKRRMGIAIEPEQLQYADVSHYEKLKERRERSWLEEEILVQRVLNDPKLAEKIAAQIVYRKEADAGLVNSDDIECERISDELKAIPGKVIPLHLENPELQALRQDWVEKVYKVFKQMPNVSEKEIKILSYILISSGFAEQLSLKKLPYQDKILSEMADMERLGIDSNHVGKYLEFTGLGSTNSHKRYDKVKYYLAGIVKQLGLPTILDAKEGKRMALIKKVLGRIASGLGKKSISLTKDDLTGMIPVLVTYSRKKKLPIYRDLSSKYGKTTRDISRGLMRDILDNDPKAKKNLQTLYTSFLRQ